MKTSIEGRAGPLLYAIAIISFGLQQFMYVSAALGPPPGPPWSSSRSPIGLVIGAILVGAGMVILLRLRAMLAINLLALVFLLRSAAIYFPGILLNIRDPRNWTSGFELLAMCGAALSLLWVHNRAGLGEEVRLAKLSGLGRILFAGPLVVFGIQHFLYAKFLAQLIPAWIPGRLFFAYLIGVLFCAAAASMISGRLARSAALLLALMFFSWVWIVHLPRVVASPHDGREWTSMFVALAMCGGGLIVAAGLKPTPAREATASI